MTATTLHDPMDPARAAALCAVLGIARPPGAPLFPFAHQAYFWQAAPEAALGRDGHPAPGGAGPVPDTGLPRRMWAGGRLEFHHPLHAGQAAEKTTVCENMRRTTGRSGPLAFVTLRHEIRQGGRLALTEWQDLAYREDPGPAAPAPPPPRAPEGGGRDRRFPTVLLFRYSALTFNGHRIHYDIDYCREVEGYPGLVVHGPLLAQLLMLMAAETGALRRFAFRATAPLFHFETATLCRDGARLWVRGPDGRLCMEATAG